MWSSWYRSVLDVADRLPVVVRFPAGPQVSLKVVTSRKAPGTDHKKKGMFWVLTQFLTESRRCTGAAFTRSLNCPKQAEPFTVKQLQAFHAVLRESEEI